MTDILVRIDDREVAFPDDQEVRLGRDPGMDVHSDNRFVSRQHAVLRFEGAEWVLMDAGSKRGTFVDGKRVTRTVVTGRVAVWLGGVGQGQPLELEVVPAPSGIFLNYRREDASGHALWLHDRLNAHFGNDRIFMDRTSIRPGTDFVLRIDRAVDSCQALLVLIGRHWTDAAAPDGRRRLDDPRDFVRIEIAAALQRGVRVIPVLVQGAVMPRPDELPKQIRALARRQAIAIDDAGPASDVGVLIRELETILADGTNLRGGSTDVSPP
jgi:hypothetical protein